MFMIVVYIIWVILCIVLFYQLMKHAVKNGMLEAYEELEERKKEAAKEKEEKPVTYVVREEEKPKKYDTNFFYYDGVDGKIDTDDLK